MDYSIRHATEADLPALLDLHNWSIDKLGGCWIEQPETMAGRAAWFKDKQDHNFPVFVVENEGTGEIVGYAAYGTYRGRDGYDLTVEHSIYIYDHAQGQGLGHVLLDLLIEEAKKRGKHMMVAIIDAENVKSIELHEKHGFVHGGALPEAGKKWGEWRSQVTLYLLLDERDRP